MELSELRKELKEVKGLGNVTINRIMAHLEKKNFINPQKQYCYSFNGEDYSASFNTIDEALEEARECNEDGCTSVYIGTVSKPSLGWLSNEEHILESMREQLYDDCGEYAIDALDISVEQEIDLGKMIDETVEEWIRKHNIKPSCFVVYDAVEYSIN